MPHIAERRPSEASADPGLGPSRTEPSRPDSTPPAGLSPSLAALAAFAVLGIAWLALEPWRPQLSGDDWGYYDSVIRTLIEGKPVVSDWLAPATVGLTVPAALATRAVGDLWTGSMAITGILGFLGLAALWSLLRDLGIAPGRAAAAVLCAGFFPLYLSYWSHFETNVPGVALLLAALTLYCRAFATGARPGAVVWLAAAGACLGWATLMRQNHLVAVAVGAVGILWLSPGRFRLPRLAAWLVAPAVAIAVLRFGVEPSFAQRVAFAYRVTTGLAPATLVSNGARLLSFSAGAAFLLTALAAPAAARTQIRSMTGLGWIAGALSLGAVVGYALLQRLAYTWLAPDTDAFLLAPPLGISAAIALLGALIWPSFLRRSAGPPWRYGLLLLAAGYLAAASVWGYWGAYLLEPVLLLFAAGLLGPAGTAISATSRPRPRAVLALSLLAIVASAAWYTQRMYNDLQVAQLSIVEHALRAGQAEPAEIARSTIPFGLAGWNMLPSQIQRWEIVGGDPLAFWNLFSAEPAVDLHWQCDTPPGQRILSRGVARIGFRDYCWVLARDPAASAGGAATTIATRYLPLTPAEWQSYLAQSGQR